MIERGRSLIAQQPRNLPERHPRILQILSREAPPQLVDDGAVCCAFFSQSSREGAQAEGQSLSHVLALPREPLARSSPSKAAASVRLLDSFLRQDQIVREMLRPRTR
jgi:hypothetical protein